MGPITNYWSHTVQQAVIGNDSSAISEIMKKHTKLQHLKLVVAQLTRGSMKKEEIIYASEF
jgi:hypothetical protein